MRQQLLKQYLEKATEPDCTKGELEEISRRLRTATVQTSTAEGTSSQENWMAEFATKLLEDVAANKPELLLGLFPAFALLCGDRNGSPFAEIDWSANSEDETPYQLTTT
jgi:hypothetical protein